MYGYSLPPRLGQCRQNPSLLSSLLTFQDSGAHDTIFGSGATISFVLG